MKERTMADEDIDLDIFVRCYSRRPLQAPAPAKRISEEALMPQSAKDILVLDCETTTGLDKKLNFGFWRWCRLQPDGYYACLEEGIFYRNDLDKKSVRLLCEFARKKPDVALGGERKMLMMSRDEFVNGPLWNIFQAGGCLVGYNLPFDISMLAHVYRPTKNGNGWSFVMFTYPNGREDKYRPRITVVSKDSYTAFIRLSKTLPRPVPCSLPVIRGRFLDLAHSVFALRNQHLTLKSACKEFRIPGKLNHKPTGRVTPEEIRYARQDVAATLNLLNAIKRELDSFGLSIRPEKVFSAASLTKGLLRDMGLASSQESSTFPTRCRAVPRRPILEAMSNAASAGQMSPASFTM
jgi:hypothetical protein